MTDQIAGLKNARHGKCLGSKMPDFVAKTNRFLSLNYITSCGAKARQTPSPRVAQCASRHRAVSPNINQKSNQVVP